MSERSSEAGCFTVGEGVSIKGSFSVPERAIINGTVEGEITAREVWVGNNGKIDGTVTAEIVDVHGEINDSLTASKALIVRATGRTKGSIQYAELEIEKGAQLRGTLTVISDTAALPKQRVSNDAPVPAKSKA